jgi:hypothetical protein
MALGMRIVLWISFALAASGRRTAAHPQHERDLLEREACGAT